MHHGGWKFLKGVTGKYDVYNLCFRCHRDVRNQVNKQSHHPIMEGKVSCVDCHNPHGTFNRRMLRADSVNELCYKCHPEKRGPFMNEHPPVEESCLTCHTPHGSNNNKLQVAQITVLCERCHLDGGHQNGPFTTFQSFNPPITGSNIFPSPRVVGRMCTNCHTNIHGSNYPGVLGQTFIR
jgi:DmsE family decaheme c-type cytochrome